MDSHYYDEWEETDEGYCKISKVLDVYSFGTLMWQVPCERDPFLKLGNNVFMKKLVFNDIQLSLSQFPESTPILFYRLALQCWSINPKKKTPEYGKSYIYSVLISTLLVLQKRSSRGWGNLFARSL
eukprot:TRINITY_DN4674_c0_g1_i2.p1 TRINITY_DN4674_c0_g1~~TRINITY_DN4674_c0_g1_i2.p1  ORF type:complete len:126 (+),score=13.36 TRINITY_DN4674_c0_g1_i2:358-735(+)